MSFPTTDPACAQWRKSTYSGGGENCVEVAPIALTVAVRDSKNPSEPALGFSRREFRALVKGIKTA
jgi:hypothetical protein